MNINSVQVIVDGGTFLALAGIFVKVWLNGKAKNGDSKTLHTMADDITGIKASLSGFDARCKQHLANQQLTNERLQDDINSLNGKVYNLAKER